MSVELDNIRGLKVVQVLVVLDIIVQLVGCHGGLVRGVEGVESKGKRQRKGEKWKKHTASTPISFPHQSIISTLTMKEV